MGGYIYMSKMSDERVDPSLPRELDKLKKVELIELIINNKVPDNVNSEVINKFLKNRSEVILKSTNDDLSLQGNLTCDRKGCVKNYYELQSNEREKTLLEKHILLMQQRISDLEYIVSLLNQKDKTFPKSQTVSGAPSNVNIVNKSAHNQLKSTQNSSQMPSTSVSTNEDNPVDGWQTVSYKNQKRSANKNSQKQKQDNSGHTFTIKEVSAAIENNQAQLKQNKYAPRQRKPIVGTNKTNSNIKSVPKLGYLHVYRLEPTTTPQDLCNELSKTAPDIPFQCESLHTTEKTCSMKVSFPIQHVKDVYNPQIWPDGALVNRYMFKNRNFSTRDVENLQV